MIISLISTFFLVIIHPLILQAGENNFHESEKTQSLSDFFNHQNQKLYKTLTESSLTYEIQTRMICNCIDMLQLPKSNIPVGGTEISKAKMNLVLSKEKFVIIKIPI